jgi:hypothetical protein
MRAAPQRGSFVSAFADINPTVTMNRAILAG